MNSREYIVDLMADPGTLIPPDTTRSILEYDDPFLSTRPFPEGSNSSCAAPTASRLSGSIDETLGIRSTTNKPNKELETSSADSKNRNSSSLDKKKVPVEELPQRPNYPFSHARSPSWTEGVSSPAAHQMKVRDVSQYMIDAANENPHLAQKLHDVLLESGVVAPPSLFSEIYPKQVKIEAKSRSPPKEDDKQAIKAETSKGQKDHDRSIFLPPRPRPRPWENQIECHKPVEATASNISVESQEMTRQPTASQADAGPVMYTKNVPAAAAAAAAAAVVASSMVVAAAKSSAADSSPVDLPVTAAATTTAAAMVATTAAVDKYEHGSPVDGEAADANQVQAERVSDHSAGDDSAKSDAGIVDAAEYEIQWEEITLGERIGLGTGSMLFIPLGHTKLFSTF